MLIRHVAFDLDDTLIPNSYHYSRAIYKCGLIVTDALAWRSPYATELVKMNYELDAEMVKTWNFRADRFPTSWVRLYEQLTGRLGVPADPDVAKRLYETAAEFQNGPFVPLAGVTEMLEELRRDQRVLHLITAGDHDLQARKIKESGLADHFQTVTITEMNKEAALKQLFGAAPSAAAMVGDSLRSDIAPAIDLGMVAVHVSSLTWPFVNATLDTAKYHSLDSILDLPRLIRELER